MIKIEYPPYQPKIKVDNNTEHIFDSIRNKWIVLTPEEWVRQNFLNFLILALQYPKALLAVEKQITIGDIKKRFDIVVFNQAAQPWMLIECKEMNVPLTEKTIQQIINYNLRLNVQYLVITNGINCMAFSAAQNCFLKNMPDFQK